MSGRTASAVITRYAGVQVQTSALGLNIPVGWGTFRCNCNLVDYLDFKSTAQKASAKGGGKGGQTTTGYSYSATLIMGVCEGPIDAISAVYVDGNLYTNGATTALQQANLNLNTGAIGQAVWSYLTSNHPDHAIGYSGLAIVYQSNYALDSAATPPNHSFEIVRVASFGVGGTEDADPSLVLTDFLTNARYGVPGWISGLIGPLTQYQNYCLAANLLVSPVIDQQRSASDFLTELFLATNTTTVWSEGVLKVIPYGDTALTGNGKTFTPNITPVYALTDDNFIPASDGEAPVMVDIEDQSDAYNVVQLEYLDRTNQYNMAIALASDAANIQQYGMRRQDPTTVHVICDPNVAAASAQLFLQRTLYIRAQYKFTLGWMFALLEPGDIVELTDAGLGLSAYPVRIIQIDQDEKAKLAIIAEDCPIGVANSPLYTSQTGSGYQANTSLDPGGVEANLLLYSDSPANAAWTKTNTSITANSTTDQYGLTLASTIVTTAGAGVHGLHQSVASFDGLNYVAGVCLQKNVRKNARVTLCDSGAANGVYIEVDLNAGVILTPATAIGTGVAVSAGLNLTLVAGIWQVVVCGQLPGVTTAYLFVDVLSDAGAHSWTASGENALYVSQLQLRQGVAIGVYAASGATALGPYIFNPPSVLTQGQQGEVWAAVAGGPNCGGCYVNVSADGSSYQQVGIIQGSARYGPATTSFASHADPDTTDTLGLDLGQAAGDLMGASQVSADNGGTMCLIDSELITYEVATLTNPSRYTLGSYIRRGFSGTPIAAHSIGAPFVRLDDAVFQFPYLAVSAGEMLYVKFQPFNAWGQGVTDLAHCIAYTFVPIPAAAASPGSAAWTATGTTLSNNGQSTPAIIIMGASDNPAATGIEFDYRVSGTVAWISAGQSSNFATQKQITSVQPSQYYDVSVLYIVNGYPSNREIVATGIQVGASSSGAAPGTTLLNDSVAGAGKTYTLPAGSYTHVDVVLTGIGGAGSGTGSKSGFYDMGGGGGATAVKLTFAVTPGTTVFTYTLPSSVGISATVTATGLSMTAPSGHSSPGSTPGVASSVATGGTNNYAGHAGGLTNTWDGGGAANINGTYTDNTTDGNPGSLPGQGGAGTAYGNQPGGAGNIQIIART